MTRVPVLAKARTRSAGGGGYGVPYPIPQSAPYNPPIYCETPTPDGTGSMVHPDVVDFGPGKKWHGWRFWMAVTPFYNSNDDEENPCILVSNDCFHWQPPAGLANPVYPMPTAPRFNSDTDMVYDPRSDELLLLYREQQATGFHQLMLARSPDGITWPWRPTPLVWDWGAIQIPSPAMIRRGPAEWVMFGLHYDTRNIGRWTTTSPEGNWGMPTWGTGTRPAGVTPWHLDVIWHAGAYRALVDMGPGASTANDGLYAASSVDGVAWVWNMTAVIARPASGWDSLQLYRPTLQPHENGTHYRVWYSAQGPDSYRVGYTELPTSLWP